MTQLYGNLKGGTVFQDGVTLQQRPRATEWVLRMLMREEKQTHTTKEIHCSAEFGLYLGAPPSALFCVSSCSLLVCAASLRRLLQTSNEVMWLTLDAFTYVIAFKCTKND